MAYNAEEWKAIKAFCDENNAKPELSARPMVYFTMPDGSEEKRNIFSLVSEYKINHKEEIKERNRVKAKLKRDAENEAARLRYKRD